MNYTPQSALLPYVLKRVLPTAAILLIVGWSVVQHTVVSRLESDVRAALSEQAQRAAGILSSRLNGLLDTAQSLATNDLVANGLIDPQEADAYVSVMFRSLRIPGSAAAEVYLTDYRGRVIAANTPAADPLSFWVETVMAGRDVVEVSGAGLLIATPVHYGGAPEGAIVLHYPPELIPLVLDVQSGSDAITIVDSDDSVLYASDDAFLAEGALWSSETGDWMHDEAVVRSPARLRVIAANRNVAALAVVDRINDIMLLAILAGLLVLTGGIVFTALITTRPLTRLASEVRRLRPLQDSTATLNGGFGTREFDDLASAFNAMLSHVRSTSVSRDHYETILNSMNELVVVTDDSGAIVDANQVAVDNIGLPRAALIRAAAARFFCLHQTSAGESSPRGISLSQAASQQTIEAECVTSKQRRFPVLVTVSRMETSVGLRYLIVALDVSELHDTRRMLENAIESIEDGFVMYDAHDRMVVCNARYRDWFTVPSETIVPGVRFEEVLRFGLERQQYPDAIGREDAWLEARMAAHRNPTGPVIQQLHDGRWAMIRERIMDDGSIVGIRTDITQLKLQQQALEKSNAELESFAYVASHDLQEPLRKIQAFGGRLQERYAGELDERGQDFLRRMIDAASRMSRLIADLLEFSRLATREHELTALDLNAVLRDVLSDLEVAIEECGATLEVSELPMIKGDYTQMRQVFQNLIGNALKFRKADTAPHVRIDAQATGATDWTITVQDNGIGFDETHAGRIFEIFQRLHGRTEYTGTGIGLAVVRKIIELHGGTITASGADGCGATFRIEIKGQVPGEQARVAAEPPAALAV